LALFRHKITLYRFNQGAHTIAGGSNGSRGWAPLHVPHTLITSMHLVVTSGSQWRRSCRMTAPENRRAAVSKIWLCSRVNYVPIRQRASDHSVLSCFISIVWNDPSLTYYFTVLKGCVVFCMTRDVACCKVAP